MLKLPIKSIFTYLCISIRNFKKYASFTQYKKNVKMKIWYNNTLRKKIEFILLKSNRANVLG